MTKKKDKETKDSESDVKTKDSKVESEEVCEIFEVEKKKGNEEVKTTCGTIEKKHLSKEGIKKQNKTLRNILIGLVVVVLLVLGVIYIFNSAGHFSYRGITGNVVQEGNLIFYQTSFPFSLQGKIVPYSIYIRNDPRKLDKIPFEGEMNFGSKFLIDDSYRLVFNIAEELMDCEDGVIAIANMANLKALGIKILNDKNASCDEEGRYMFMNIIEGEESKITQVGNNCYNLVVNDCEILKVTERFMVEAFVKYYS